MITNFKKQSRKDDLKLLTWIIFGFLFVAWLCTPPGNKFLQICFWGNNTKLFVSKITHDNDAKLYVFHRNNAVYLAKMYPKDPKRAIKEMDKAFKTTPTYISTSELQALYKDRASIKMYAGDYQGALSDYMNSGSISFNDNLKIALLYKEVGNNREALKYCNNILNADPTAYAGYACLTNLYNSIGKYTTSLKIWDLAINRRGNNPYAYVSRASVKQTLGDEQGAKTDLATAQKYSPGISIEDSEKLINETLHPKIILLTISKS